MAKDFQFADPVELARLQGLDRQFHLHSFTDPQALVTAPPFMMESAHGVYVRGQGIELLDAMSGLGNVNIGYGRPEMAEVAAEAMNNLSFYHTFAAISNPYIAKLSAKLIDLCPGNLNTVFFANSGSEANETAIKLARLYWRRQGQTGKRMILSRDFAYHGSTTTVSALNGLTAMHEPFGIRSQGGVAHTSAPFWYRFGGDMTEREFGLKAAQDVEDKILEIGADNIAAFIAEPIQATLGCIIPPDNYWPAVEKICRKHNILIIADEVVTGLGRTGAWFAQETFGFQADIMTLAKGLSSGYMPIAATIFSEEVISVIEGYGNVLQHGFTTSGHPVAAAVALKNIEIIEQENLIGHIKNDVGPYLKEKLEGLLDIPIVGEVRVQGMMVGIEIASNKITREQYPIEYGVCQHVAQACLTAGLIVRPAGNILMLCPPFIITKDDIDRIERRLRGAIEFVVRLLDKEGLLED